MDYIEKAKAIREIILKFTTKAGVGHVTSSFSCVELFVALYYGNIMKFDAKNPTWSERDYFIYSKGHASPIIYCVLADLGFFDEKKLDLFAQENGELGVLLKSDIPGAEIISGSLGHGLGIAAGLGEGMLIDDKPNKIFCMLGDGELREGSIWESAMYIGARKLNNIVTIIDKNKLAAIHFTEDEAPIEPVEEKFRAFGFETCTIDGHNMDEIFQGFSMAKKSKKPFCIIANTIKGKGVSFIENQPFMHGCAVKESDLQRALEEVRLGL